MNQWAASGEKQDEERHVQFWELSGEGRRHCFELLLFLQFVYVTECIECVPGHDPLIFFPVVLSLFLIGREFYGPNYPKC